MTWLARRFRELGLPTSVEAFTYDMGPAWRALRALLVCAAGLTLWAGLLAPDRPATALLLLLAALGPGLVFLAWAPGLEALYRRPGSTRTANIEARRPAVGKARQTVIILAHHDSKSQNLTFPWRAGATAVTLLGALALAIYLVLAVLRGEAPGPAAWPRIAGLGTSGALGLLSFLKSGNLSPGGVDNAGSVGIVLELARVLPSRVPEDVELIFLSPGAEEDHMVGAMRWLDRHLGELRPGAGPGGGKAGPVHALNFDGAGAPGRLVLMNRYGFGKAFSPRLTGIARNVAARLGYHPRGIIMPPAMGIDAIPFAHRGIDCLTIGSGSPGPAVWAVHSAGDVADHLDEEVLTRAARLGAGIIEGLVGEEPDAKATTGPT